ncbi:MAG: hypothetical protein LBF63_05775 [Treponema sp.]|jgi:hypothetical protein|nr:hypothetical protein [Treponema sp.]
MKNILKVFGIAAPIAVIVLLTATCKMDEDYDMLNGAWERTSDGLVVTFDGDRATFTQVTGTGWESVKNAGNIAIGDRKFKDIHRKGDSKWTCQELVYNTSTYVTSWEDCTITMSKSGRTIAESSSSGSHTYTKM